MKLKETMINLVGFFECSIENNTIMCAGLDRTFKNDDGEDVVDLFIFDVLDVKNNTLVSPSILVGFNQVGDKILFLYKKDKYEVVSISDNLIKVKKDGIDYFIKRIPFPF